MKKLMLMFVVPLIALLVFGVGSVKAVDNYLPTSAPGDDEWLITQTAAASITPTITPTPTITNTPEATNTPAAYPPPEDDIFPKDPYPGPDGTTDIGLAEFNARSEQVTTFTLLVIFGAILCGYFLMKKKRL